MKAPSNRAGGRLGRMLARFAKTRRGSAAVEFAMVALPFLALIFGILELSMIYLVSTTLENATADTARKIRTGELQTAGGATASPRGAHRHDGGTSEVRHRNGGTARRGWR